MSYKDYREESRAILGMNQERNLSHEQLNLGAILRIADAVEKMAEPFARLMEERDWFKRKYEERGGKIDHLERRIRSLKGVITKLKK